MKSTIYKLILILIINPLIVTCVSVQKGLEESTVAPVVDNVVLLKDDVQLNIENSQENKVQAEIISQNINMQKCTNSPWCKYIPKKNEKKLRTNIFQWSKIKEYQQNPIAINIRLLKGQSKTKLKQQFAKFLTGECPRNLSVAWLKKIDLDEDLKVESEKMYNFVKECQPESSHEEMYLRQALYFYSKQDLIKAKESILNALTVQNEEVARINYWAGEILEDKKYYEEVVKKSPYSWHAVLSAQKLGFDLFEHLKKRKQYELTESNHDLVSWVKILLKFKKYKELDVLLKWNINNSIVDIQTWFYINRLVVQHSPVNISLNLTTRLANNKPDYVNIQILDFSFPNQYKDIFHTVKGEVDFDPYLLMSLTKQESGFNPQAKSSAKAWGLMQLLPATARYVSGKKHNDLKDPYNNVNLGVKYLSTLYNQLGTVEYALAAYNAGPNRVIEWLKYEPNKKNNILMFMDLIPFKETRSYVALILRNHYFYRQLNGVPDKNTVESEQFKKLSF